MEDNVALGRYWRTGSKVSIETRMMMDAIAEAKVVRPPALDRMRERGSEPKVG
jgi:hypothetical protein